MKKILGSLILGLAGVFSCAVQADNKAIEAAVAQLLPGVKPDSIKQSPMNGLFEVTVGPKLFYVSGDGRYLIQGSLVDVKAREDLTEKRLASVRIQALDKMGSDDMLIFKPKIAKHLVYVFTDIDCGYCRKLHSEMDQYQQQGIEIRYLFFPRAGEGSESYKKAVAVWCAKDRNEALTKAKRGENLEMKECDNPVDEHMKLGNDMGANGTPMLVTAGGSVLPGYVPAAQLVKMLERESVKTSKK